MKTPREVGHKRAGNCLFSEIGHHSLSCDSETEAIAARDAEWAALRAADAARITELEGALLRIESGEPWTDEATGLPVYDPQALARRCRATKPGMP